LVEIAVAQGQVVALAQLPDHVAFQQRLGKRQAQAVQAVDLAVELFQYLLQASAIDVRRALHGGQDAGQALQFLDDFGAQVTAREQVGQIQQMQHGGPVVPHLIAAQAVVQVAQHELDPQQHAHALVERLLVGDEIGWIHNPPRVPVGARGC
jgi:hypothetical protein